MTRVIAEVELVGHRDRLMLLRLLSVVCPVWGSLRWRRPLVVIESGGRLAGKSLERLQGRELQVLPDQGQRASLRRIGEARSESERWEVEQHNGCAAAPQAQRAAGKTERMLTCVRSRLAIECLERGVERAEWREERTLIRVAITRPFVFNH